MSKLIVLSCIYFIKLYKYFISPFFSGKCRYLPTCSEYFIEAFKANPDTQWWFGIDGLPKHSHKYRKNQDGEKQFKRLLLAKEHLNKLPIWQMILFSYNENDLDECMKMADEVGVIFNLINSSRWYKDDGSDPLIPKGKEKLRIEEQTFNPKVAVMQ